MITRANEERAISTLGWVDHGAVWIFDAGGSEPRTVPLSDAQWLTLHGGRQGHFVSGGPPLARRADPHNCSRVP